MRLQFDENGRIIVPQTKLENYEKEIDIEKCKKFAKGLFNEYYNKKGVFSKFSFPSEYNLPKGMHKGGEEQLLYITLTLSLNYMRNADSLWKQSHDAWLNNEINWIFNPQIVLDKGETELVNIFLRIKDQRPNKDALIWFAICKKLKDFDFNIMNLLETFDFDAVKISDYLEDNKKDFPFLSGYKIKPLWLRIINETIGIKLKNIKEIPLPIDVHTARMTLKIVFNEPFSGKIDKNLRKRTQNIWKFILENEEIYPLQLDEPLWLIGKYRLLDKFLNQIENQNN